MKPTRKEIAKEILENMDLTKEQYISLCELYDELGLEKKKTSKEERLARRNSPEGQAKYERVAAELRAMIKDEEDGKA